MRFDQRLPLGSAIVLLVFGLLSSGALNARAEEPSNPAAASSDARPAPSAQAAEPLPDASLEDDFLSPLERPKIPDEERSIIYRTGKATVIFGRDTLFDTIRIVISPVGWSGKQWFALGMVGATTGLLITADEDIRKRAQTSEGFKKFGDQMHKLSNGPLPAGVMGAFALSGMLLDRPKDITTARLALESTLISGVLVIGLKSALGRARPRENRGATDFEFFGGNHSMPSGEVTTAFAIAQVVAERYPNWPTRIIAYGLATAIAAARIGDDAHWASDIFLGAATGIAVSHAIMRYDERRKTKKDLDLAIMPGGFRLTYHF